MAEMEQNWHIGAQGKITRLRTILPGAAEAKFEHFCDDSGLPRGSHRWAVPQLRRISFGKFEELDDEFLARLIFQIHLPGLRPGGRAVSRDHGKIGPPKIQGGRSHNRERREKVGSRGSRRRKGKYFCGALGIGAPKSTEKQAKEPKRQRTWRRAIGAWMPISVRFVAKSKGAPEDYPKEDLGKSQIRDYSDAGDRCAGMRNMAMRWGEDGSYLPPAGRPKECGEARLLYMPDKEAGAGVYLRLKWWREGSYPDFTPNRTDTSEESGRTRDTDEDQDIQE
jgi:hypothetical protein